LKRKLIAYIAQIIAVILVPFGMVILLLVFPSFPIICVLLPIIIDLILHIPQIPKAMKIGKEKGLSPTRIVIKTILFGAAWWKFVKNGTLEK